MIRFTPSARWDRDGRAIDPENCASHCYCEPSCIYVCDGFDFFGAWQGCPSDKDDDGDGIFDCICTCDYALALCKTLSPDEYNGGHVRIRNCTVGDSAECITCTSICDDGFTGIECQPGQELQKIDFKVTLTNVRDIDLACVEDDASEPERLYCQQCTEFNRTYFFNGCNASEVHAIGLDPWCDNLCRNPFSLPGLEGNDGFIPGEIAADVSRNVATLCPDPDPDLDTLLFTFNLQNDQDRLHPFDACPGFDSSAIPPISIYHSAAFEPPGDCLDTTWTGRLCGYNNLEADASGLQNLAEHPCSDTERMTAFYRCINNFVWPGPNCPQCVEGDAFIEVLPHESLESRASRIAEYEPFVVANALNENEYHEARIIQTGSTSQGPVLSVAVYKNGTQLAVSGAGIVIDRDDIQIDLLVCVYNEGGQDKIKGHMIAVDVLQEITKCIEVEADTDVIPNGRKVGYGQYGRAVGGDGYGPFPCPANLFTFQWVNASIHNPIEDCPCFSCPP